MVKVRIGIIWLRNLWNDNEFSGSTSEIYFLTKWIIIFWRGSLPRESQFAVQWRFQRLASFWPRTTLLHHKQHDMRDIPFAPPQQFASASYHDPLTPQCLNELTLPLHNKQFLGSNDYRGERTPLLDLTPKQFLSQVKLCILRNSQYQTVVTSSS